MVFSMTGSRGSSNASAGIGDVGGLGPLAFGFARLVRALLGRAGDFAWITRAPARFAFGFAIRRDVTPTEFSDRGVAPRENAGQLSWSPRVSRPIAMKLSTSVLATLCALGTTGCEPIYMAPPVAPTQPTVEMA